MEESLEQLRAIIHSATDAIITIDERHRVTLFNAGAEAMFRCKAADVVGTPLDRFIPERFRTAHRSFIDAFGKTGDTTRPMGGERLLAALRADGVEFPMEARISHSMAAGRRLYTVIIRDVTERVEAAKALRDSEARFKGIIASATDAIITVDDQHRVTLFNAGAEAMFGYSTAEMRGQPLDRLLPARFREGHAEYIRRFGETGVSARTMGGERILVGLRRTGEEFPIEARISQVAVRGTQLYTVIIRDVTERIHAEEEREELLARERAARAEAEAANRAKDELLSTVSHELRTPLTAMLGWVRLLRDGRLSGDRARRAVEVIERSGQSQAKLIDDLLDLGRIVTGRLRVDMRRVALPGVVGSALETLRAMADQKGVRLAFRAAAEPVLVVGDAERLQQVVWNLVNNAIKFTPSGGRVDVELAVDGAAATLVVRDTGPGIPPEFVPRLFEPFQQAESVRSREGRGLGLGLSIVRRLTELHRGTVEVATGPSREGASFIVRLPLAGPHDAFPERPAGVERLDGLRVLVVDDDGATLELVRELLEQCGAQVTTAASVAAAREALDRWALDVVVSDLRLPDADGYDLIRTLRASPGTRGIPAVALTAYAREEDERRALDAGFQLRLEKPFDPQQLVAAVAQAGRSADPGRTT
jgi:PAS domain S-box-containing protein